MEPSHGLLSSLSTKNIDKEMLGRDCFFSIWRFTNHFAWGVLSANPYAIRALEKATRRRCQPLRIKVNVNQLMKLGSNTVPYLKDINEIAVTNTESRINTKFFLDHSNLPKMLADVISKESWQLGPLPEGWEWFAFTFKDQPQIGLTQRELDEMLAASDQVTKEAYSRMPLSSDRQVWAKYADPEAEFAIESCQLKRGAKVLDFGCGHGRHSIALAAKGIDVTGVDFIPSFIETAREKARQVAGISVDFICADCRSFEADTTFDAVICLYDVVGSHAREDDNRQMLLNVAEHLKPGGYLLLSVMNMEFTSQKAKHWFSISSEADKLLNLSPSDTMERTGEVFNPDFYMIDRETKIVYRKEQFRGGEGLPEEFVVRDRRYTKEEIASLCSSVGLEVVWNRLVRSGKWKDEETDVSKAKEILLLCKKPTVENLQVKLF